MMNSRQRQTIFGTIIESRYSKGMSLKKSIRNSIMERSY
jgi:hypothetical protein